VSSDDFNLILNFVGPKIKNKNILGINNLKKKKKIAVTLRI
jgi:hypothetical protein